MHLARALILSLSRRTNGISGPVINSPRQLWSVAAYINMVQEIVFGLSMEESGLSVSPCITSSMHKSLLAGSREITLKGISCHGRQISIKLLLPEPAESEMLYEIKSVRRGGNNFKWLIPYDRIGSIDEIVVELGRADNATGGIVMVSNLESDEIFAPDEPVITEVAAEELVTLKWQSVEGAETYRVYRNGEIAADNLRTFLMILL